MMAENPFQQIIDHVDATMQAEQAIGQPALAARLRAEAKSTHPCASESQRLALRQVVAAYGDFAPTYRDTNDPRMIRLHQLEELIRRAKPCQCGFAGETVERRLLELFGAVQRMVARGDQSWIETQPPVALALTQVQSLADAVRPEQMDANGTITRPTQGCTDTILAHGDRQYSIGGSQPIRLTETESMVFDAYLEPRGKASMFALDKPNLCKRSVEHAPSVLRKLTTKYGRIFSPAIQLPGGKKANGGYRVRIQRAEDAAVTHR